MTAIAGVVDSDGWVAIATDGVAIQNGMTQSNPMKGMTLQLPTGEHAIAASAGRAALGPLLRYALKIDGIPDPADAEGCNRWAQAVADAFTELAIEKKLVEDGEMAGAALFGWRGYLWELSHGLAMPIERFWAIGCGERLIIGALDILDQAGVFPADEMAARAVEVACRYDSYCEPPVNVLTTRRGDL